MNKYIGCYRSILAKPEFQKNSYLHLVLEYRISYENSQLLGLKSKEFLEFNDENPIRAYNSDLEDNFESQIWNQ